jgi:hypothetical protein
MPPLPVAPPLPPPAPPGPASPPITPGQLTPPQPVAAVASAMHATKTGDHRVTRDEKSFAELALGDFVFTINIRANRVPGGHKHGSPISRRGLCNRPTAVPRVRLR